MEYTKKIIYQSNYWYNDGLKKARRHDLSGAVVSLRRSLQYNRENIQARNLLGLVYYGRGEVAEGLVEWILSKNLQPKENRANYFIQEIQNTPSELELIDQAVKRYNQCLLYCSQKGEDLAIIQLKKVVSAHPSFLKAYQLLALLYLHTEQYTKAKQVLRIAKKIDISNEITLRYIREVSQKQSKKPKQVEKEKSSRRPSKVEREVDNDAIVPTKDASENTFSAKLTIANILAGAMVGATVVWFLIVPAVDESKTTKVNQQVLEYSERISALEAQVSAQTRALDEYRQMDQDSASLLENAQLTVSSYENLLTAYQQWSADDYDDELVANTLLEVSQDLLDDVGQSLYKRMVNSVYPGACETLYEAGKKSYEVANYTGAVTSFEKVVAMDEEYDNGGALFRLGNAYMKQDEVEKATIYYKRVIELYPNSQNAKDAKDNLDMMEHNSNE
jgi:tetratricopeptide (TPR) repeat protein